MEPAPHEPRSVDVTGLPEEAIRAVEVYVAQLRGQPVPAVPAPFRSYAEWAKALREWAESHPRRDTLADDSRVAIFFESR